MDQVFGTTNNGNYLDEHQIGIGPFSNTSLATHKGTNEKFSRRLIPIHQNDTIDKFKNVWNRLSKKQYPCFAQPSFAELQISLYTPYAENQSLKEVIQKLEKGETISNFDSTQRLIIIYGILMFLDAIHHDNQFHGRLKISNILLNSEFYPLVSDAFLFDLNENGPLTDSNNKMIDYIVSIPPEIIKNNDYTSKSDIYSLGIIILQILTHKINVYSDITDDCSEIIKLKENEQLPNIPESQNQELRDLICRCLKSDPEERPTANEMIDAIEKIGCDGNEYDIQRLNKFILNYKPIGETVIKKKVQKPITCKEYPLSFSNGVYYLCAPKIQSNSSFTFQINNTFIDQSSEITYQLIYFEDNEAVSPNYQRFQFIDEKEVEPDVKNNEIEDNEAVSPNYQRFRLIDEKEVEPDVKNNEIENNQAVEIYCNKNKNELALKVLDSNHVTRLHSMLKIKLSETLMINVEIDSIIVPFEFGFDLYDYNEKKYVTNSTIYYSSKYYDRQTVLNFRIYGEFLSEKYVEIQNNFQNPVKVVNISKNNFTIHEDSEFNITIQIMNKMLCYSYLYYVSVKIGDIEKRIRLKFEESKLIESNKYITYGFDCKQKEWRVLSSNQDDSNDIVCIVNPFNSLNKFNSGNKIGNKISVPMIKWEKMSFTPRIEIYNFKNANYVTLDKHGECNIRTNMNEYKFIPTSTSLSIFGICDNEWYPVFNDYDDNFKSFSLLECINENIGVAEEKLSKIPLPNLFGSNKLMQFIQFAGLLKSGIQVLHNMDVFVGKFPPSFHENELYNTLNSMLYKLKTIEETDQFLPIFQYNLIYIFYTIFKKRYDEIQNNNGYLFNMNFISESTIEQKVQELYEKYIEIDPMAKNNKYSNENQRIIERIERDINNIKSKQCLDLVKSESFKTIQTNSTKNEQNLVSKISTLKDLINKENEAKKARYKQRLKEKQNDEQIPTLIFGSENVITQKDFIAKLNSTTTIFSSLMENTEKEILNSNITDTFFNETQKVNDEYDNISTFLIVKFTDQEECPVIQNLLNDVKVIYVDLKSETSDLESLVNKKIFKNYSSSDVKQNTQDLGGNVNAVLRFSIQWNDIGQWDKNDLDAHCIEPNGFEIMYNNRVDAFTGGNLDVDIINPEQGVVACENIAWPDLNRMKDGTYRFFVHQYRYRDGHSGFRAHIEFDNKIYHYDYRSTLPQDEKVDVAYVTLQKGKFSISHKLPLKK